MPRRTEPADQKLATLNQRSLIILRKLDAKCLFRRLGNTTAWRSFNNNAHRSMNTKARQRAKSVTSEPMSHLSRHERPSPRRYLMFASLAAMIWIVLTWGASTRYVAHREQTDLLEAETDIARGIDDVATGLRRNLAVYHGIPATIGRDQAIRDVLAALPANIIPSPLAREERQKRWQQQPALALLNHKLAASTTDIPAFSVIWVMNAAGDTLAASNADTPGSFVGTNYADRDYFKAAINGRHGNQFAVGRMTRVPGLFFSAPVLNGERVIGVVAVKIDLPFLAFWVNQTNAFITDPYGVIIMAQDKQLEMRALPGATVHGLTAAQRKGRYIIEHIPEVSVTPWGKPPHPTLKQLNGGKQPVLMRSLEIPSEGLTITVMKALPLSGGDLSNQAGLFAASASVGVLALILFTAAAFYIGNWQRVRRYHEAQAQVEYLATHDALTGLFSRAMIEQLVPQSIALAERTGRRLAVLFVDLDMFKSINDTMGHEVGDEVLREVALRLHGVVRAADAVIRQGGDEFLILLTDLESTDDAAHVARKLIDALSLPYLIREKKLKLSASVGIAIYPEDGDTVSALIRNADSALYHVKDTGRADFRFYHADMNADAMARLTLEGALRDALERKEFVLYYQPKCELAGEPTTEPTTRRIASCEALVRWQHPTEGLVPPARFIPVAEKIGLIVALDDWVLLEACRQMQEWRAQRGYDMTIAVNVSAVDFRKPGLVERVKNALQDSGLPPACLELELTESAIMDDAEAAVTTLAALKAMGVRLAIDDFGTGYSSLAYLKRFDADVLKIDREFVRDIDTDASDRAIASTIIQLAKAIDCLVVAEGVETEAHAALLGSMGCDLAQGFWLAKPLPADEFVAFVTRQNA